MDAAPTFAIIGEALIDLVDPGDDTPCLAHAGGSPYNVAIGLARLGQPTALIARFSQDGLGAVLRDHARRSNVDLSWCVDDPARATTTAMVSLTDGIATYHFTIEGTAGFAWTDAELVLPASAQIVHTGSLASWLPPGSEVIGRRLAALHAAGDVLVSYDPNVRPQLQPDVAAARAQIEATLRHVHVVKASDEDVTWLYGQTPLATVARDWLAAGPALVVITRGALGPIAFTADAEPLERTVRTVDVVDTVGAGDAFTSGLLDGLQRHSITSPSALPTIVADRAMLADVLDNAALVAALTCTRAGAAPPRRAELDAALAQG